MKNKPQNLKKWIAPLGLICLLALTLASCVKSGPPTQSKPLAGLEVINASPDAPPLSFYIGSTQITQSSLVLGDFTYYFSAYAGINLAGFYQAGTSTVVAQSNITLAPTTYYTLFLANVKATPDFIFLKDSVYNPASGYTALRFVDASPDAPAVDLVIKGGTKIVQNYTYKNASAFLPIPIPIGGHGIDTLQIVQSGTGTVLVTLPPKVFIANADYTVWLYGLANTSVPAEGLNANIMENIYFN